MARLYIMKGRTPTFNLELSEARNIIGTHPITVPDTHSELLAHIDAVDIEKERGTLLKDRVELALDDTRRVERLADTRVRERDVWIC